MYRVTFGLDRITVSDAESLKEALVHAALLNGANPEQTIEVEELKIYACRGIKEELFTDSILAGSETEAEQHFEAMLEDGSIEPDVYSITKLEVKKK